MRAKGKKKPSVVAKGVLDWFIPLALGACCFDSSGDTHDWKKMKVIDVCLDGLDAC